MGTIWADSVRRSLNEAVDLLGAVIHDCPDELWRVPMWRVQPSEIVGEVYDDAGVPISGSARREERVQRWSQPWSVAWHALEVLDYDLAGELVPWSPPPPFAGNPHWQTFTSLPVGWSRPELAGYVAHCRGRIHDVLGDLTEDGAATLLPATHRYAGKPYAWIVTSLIGHTTAHAVQIRQFTSTRETPPVPPAA
ncbi:DinB family protein [Nocardioides cynanchi]|uniref:DinB family protein n=1 Tax=Nocardioides cynanchi TaxID=2558918 RepID=UPI00124508B4|nr:DinB family protein [Nocardioides cynanchi]